MRLRTGGFLLILLSSSLFGSTSIYWYNGDPNLLDGLRQNVNGMAPGLTYDDFFVGTGGLEVNGFFSNDFMKGSINQAFWEIRSDVSNGDGGTVVASGTDFASQTDTGLSGFGFEIYRIQVNGLDFLLAPGHYWLTLAPVLTGDTQISFLATTSGVQGSGSPRAHDGLSYFDSDTFGLHFVSTDTQITQQSADGGHLDFSEGVLGTSAQTPQPVPEPATVSLAIGVTLMAIGRRRRSTV